MGSRPPSQDGASQSTSSTIYFGYGSNLWLEQMHLRCPTSKYLGVARLEGYRWIINDRRYANVVQKGAQKSDHVYALVYSLLPTDEARLDKNEGVPESYTKEWLEVDFWPGDFEDGAGKADITKDPKKASMLVYIDRKRLTEDTPWPEYIHRMNKGIEDAVKMGVPEKYIEKNLRPFIPEEHDKEFEELARRQAMNFEDES